MNIRVFFVLTVALLTAACAGQQAEQQAEAPDTAADQQAIADLAGQFAQAYNQKDAAALTAFFTADAQRLPPDQPMHQGSQAIQENFQKFFDAYDAQISIEPVDSAVSGDWAYGQGTYKITLQQEEGEPIEEIGKWINILHKESDGSWKISRNIWNSDSPSRFTPPE